MGQVLHGSARTTEAVRRAIQLRQEGVRALAERYGVSPTTIQKWRKRETTTDAQMGPKEPRPTVLTPEEEAVIVAFRATRCCHSTIAFRACSRASRVSPDRRCTVVSKGTASAACPRSKATNPSAVSSPTTRSAILTTTSPKSERKGKLYLFVAIDRTSKFAFTRLEKEATRQSAADFLRSLVEAVPYQIHTI